MQESILTVSTSVIDRNSAGDKGGGVRAQTSSAVTLGDGTSVSRNTARNSGGGLGLLKSSSLTTVGRVRIHANSAIGSGGSGGGVAASTSTVRLGAGNIDLSYNTAAADGGALTLSEGSSLTDAGDAALGCLLTVHHNKAETGNGGGYTVSGDSSVSLPVSTAVFSQNVAAHQGGGLFIAAGPAEFDSSKAMECSVAKVTFWRLDLVDNAASTGDGGGVCVVVCGK